METRTELRTGLLLARIAGTLALLAAAYLVLRPFLVPMIWASIVAYVTWPLYARARAKLGRPALVAGLFTLSVMVLIGIPVGWFVVALADQGTALARLAIDWLYAGAPLPEWLSSIPWVKRQIESVRELAVPTNLTPYLASIGGQVSNGLVRLAGGLARNVFAFGVTLLGLYSLYVDGEGLTRHARRIVAAFFPTTSPQFLEDVGAVVRAVVFGLVGTAIAQGLLAGIGFAIFGVPFPVPLGALTAIFSFVPAGPVLIWGGASVWLLVSGHMGAAAGMAIWGLVMVSTLDNVLRPLLISRSGAIRIPFLVVFFGVLGGLAAFGLLGLFVGPVVLSVAFTLIADFPSRGTERAIAEPPAA
jgi:predicted PurR-regulated permease PerM